MGVKTYSDNANTAIKYSFQRKAGRSIIERVPVFSPNGESVLVIVENIVRVYNINTGDCSRTLETETPVNELVAIQFPENESHNLYGCSEKGCVTTWTWENGTVLRETKLSIPQYMKILTFNLLDNNECFITAAKKNSETVYLGIYSMKTGTLIHNCKNTRVEYHENMIKVAVGWMNGERFAAIVNGTARLFIQNLTQPHFHNSLNNANLIRILTVAAHKTEAMVATTDALGRATIFRGDLYNHERVAREVFHWHYLPATAICFSSLGSYLYTGGMERVMVKWTLGHLANTANEKMFIPRLPAMVRYIATNNAYVAAVLSNNSIVIASPQMRVVSTILECGGVSPLSRALGFPLLYHRRLSSLLLGGRTGHLQLYSTANDKVLYNIDVTGLNQIAPLRHNLIPLETEVTCAAISSNGSWLVTSEYRNDGVSYPEERLKFWALHIKSAAPFSLNTCVNLSHGGCRVLSIALNDRGEYCVTAGGDQKFRIWRRDSKNKSKETWYCLTACYYSSGISQTLSHGIMNNYKNGELPPADNKRYPYTTRVTSNDVIVKLMNVHKEHSLIDPNVVNAGITRDDENDMSGVAISQDGSLIAAWFGCKLTLWDSHLCNLRTSLSHPLLRPKGVFVQFGQRDAAHYLVCSTETCVAVWSLLSLTVKWIVPISATCLVSDPLSNRVALVTTSNDVYVFTPHSATPLLTHKRVCSPASGLFRHCCFGDSSETHVRLYLVRNDSEIYCLEPEQSESGQLEVVSRRSLPASNFSALLAEQQLSEVRASHAGDVTQLDTNRLANTALAQFLSAAPHMVPPVSLLCTSFLHHISGVQENTSEEPEDDVMEIDQSSEDEDDTPSKSSHAPKPAQLWAPNYDKLKEKRLQKILKEPLLNLLEIDDIFD